MEHLTLLVLSMTTREAHTQRLWLTPVSLCCFAPADVTAIQFSDIPGFLSIYLLGITVFLVTSAGHALLPDFTFHAVVLKLSLTNHWLVSLYRFLYTTGS